VSAIARGEFEAGVDAPRGTLGNEGDECGPDIVAVCGEDRVAFGDELRQEAIAADSRSRISASVMGSASWRPRRRCPPRRAR
jgi:hypothetical protein